MCKILVMSGAEVTEYALKPPTEPSLFDICRLSEQINSIEGDVRDLRCLKGLLQVEAHLWLEAAMEC